MKKFVYKAWDNEFNIIKSEIEEDDIAAATQNLKGKSLKIIYIKEKSSLAQLSGISKKLTDESLSNFCGQIAMILNSGVSLLNGLEIIEQQTKNKDMKKIIAEIIEDVKRGNNLAVAMQSVGRFPKLLTDMVMTGEITGNLDNVLFNMENFYKREANIKSKIKSASIYPLLILIVAVGMMVFFNFFIFPELKDLFKNSSLPAITIFVLGMMNFLNTNYLGVIAGTLAFIIIIKYIVAIPKAKYFLDKILLRLPVWGTVKMDIITSRFTRSMGIFLKSAVPIITVMENMKLIVENDFISSKIENVKDEIMGGTKLADSIGNQQVFEPLVIQMIKVGEETGQLDDMMFKLADIYDGRVETGIGRLMSLVEPVLTLVIGIVVGTVILGMALPIMNMTQSMK
jgi:type IV pilus assembly protein PilC